MKKTTINAQEKNVLSHITVTPETKDVVKFLLEINPNITAEGIYQEAVNRTKSDIQEMLHRQADIMDCLACSDADSLILQDKAHSILAGFSETLRKLTSERIKI